VDKLQTPAPALPRPGMAGGTPTRRRRPGLVGTVVVLAVAAILAGCTRGDDTNGDSRAAATPAASKPASIQPAATGTTARRVAAVLADGRHPVFLKAVDAKRRTVTFDLIQFYTGRAAAKAAAEDHQESPPPNDHYIRNTNPRLRTLRVRPGAPITVNTLAFEETGSSTRNVVVSLAKLASWFPRESRPTFWITVQDGRVVRIQEQFLP
jgi:hypothetical protein